MTPVKKWEEYYQKTLLTFTLSGEAEVGHAGEQPARNNLTNEDDQQGRVRIILCSSQPSLLTMPSKTQSGCYGTSDEPSVANPFEKIVQVIGTKAQFFDYPNLVVGYKSKASLSLAK